MLAGLSMMYWRRMPPDFCAAAPTGISNTTPIERARNAFGIIRRLPRVAVLSVEPDVLEPPRVVDAVDHDGQVLDRRLHAGRGLVVEDDRPRGILLQAAVDLPHEFFALLLVGLARLPHEQLLERRVAVAGDVAVRT